MGVLLMIKEIVEEATLRAKLQLRENIYSLALT